MKKWMILLMTVALLLTLSACGNKTPHVTEETLSITETPTETEGPSETTEITTETEASTETETTEATTEEATETVLQETFWAEEDLEYPMAFYFSSGVGGWGTELFLYEDGSFTGYFHDSSIGENGEEYPNGTVYVCEFTGEFGPAERLDMYTYGMKLEELTMARPEGEEWIEDGIRYITAMPYGLEDGENFNIYLPNTPAEMLSEDAYIWWPYRYYDDHTTLDGYGLYNLNGEYGFYCMVEQE